MRLLSLYCGYSLFFYRLLHRRQWKDCRRVLTLIGIDPIDDLSVFHVTVRCGCLISVHGRDYWSR